MTRRLGWPLRAALFLAALATLASWLRADTLPPKPDRYFNDQAGVVDATTASQINEQLAQFERDTSSQIVVAIYPALPDGEDLSDYCVRTANSWVNDRNKYGQLTGGSNSAVLFVFVNSHQMFIATGRDLEGALPDITCKQIIDNEIAPRFRQGDFAGGVQAGVNALLAATKGEYKGTGQTAVEQQQGANHNPDNGQQLPVWVVILIFVLIMVLSIYMRSSGGPMIISSGGFGGGGWGGGGGGGGSSFGGFSGGGGGGFGGGGAGGSW